MESEEKGRQNSKTIESDEATGPFFLGNLDDVDTDDQVCIAVMRSSNEVNIELKARIILQKSTTHNQAALYILVQLYFELKQNICGIFKAFTDIKSLHKFKIKMDHV